MTLQNLIEMAIQHQLIKDIRLTPMRTAVRRSTVANRLQGLLRLGREQGWLGGPWPPSRQLA